MTTTNTRYSIWIISSVIGMSFLISIVRVIQEHIQLSYSGFGPWQPIIQLPFIILIAGIIASLVQVIAKIAKWRKIQLIRDAVIFGGICGLVPISDVIKYCCNTIVSRVPDLDLVVVLIVFFAAVFFRFHINNHEKQ